MPKIFQEDLLLSTQASLDKPEVEQQEEQPVSSFSDTVKASFMQDNSVFNVTRMALESDVEIDDTVDLDYDPFNDIEGYELDAGAFVNSKNSHETAFIKTKIDFDREQKEILANAPTWSAIVGGVMANTIDPLMFIPLSKTANIASRAARTAQGVASGVALGAAGGITREGILQSSQTQREVSESVTNVLAESAFGGMFGGVVGAIANPVKTASKSIMSKAMRGDEYKINIDEEGKPYVARSVGAAESARDIEDEGLAYLNNSLARNLGGFGTDLLSSPTLRGITSEFESTRSLTNGLFLHNFILGKNVKGIATEDSAEALIRRDESRYTMMKNDINNLYYKHTGQGALGSSFNLKEGKLNFKEFNERITKVLRNEDLVDDIPEVNKAAQAYRKELNNITKDLQELKLLPEDIDPNKARNYFTRVYDTRKMLDVDVRKNFLGKVSKWLRTHDAATGKALDEPMDAVTSDQVALDIYNNIMKQGDNFSPINNLSDSLVAKEGFLKEKGLLMPDEQLEEFLNNDAQLVTSNYFRRASSLINIHKSLNNMGFKNFDEFRMSLNSEFEQKLATVTDLKERARLKDVFERDKELTNDMFKLMTGNLRKPGKVDKYVEGLMQYQYVRLLGGVSLSSLPELAMQPFRFGLLNTFRDGFMPMIRDFKASKLVKDEYKYLDVGLENEQSNLLRSLADPDHQLGTGYTEYERMMEKLLGPKLSGFTKLTNNATLNDTFSKASMITYWTSAGRRLSAQIASADIMRTMESFAAGKVLDSSKIAELASIGIGKTDYDKIAAQVKKHGIKRNGSWISNVHLWDDEQAYKAFSSGVQRQVESVVIKPSRGDIPIYAQKNQIARLMFQFKSFSSSASNKILISSMQRRDARTLTGLMMLSAMGSMTSIIKDKVAGREADKSPEDLILEGISRSGMMGLLGGTVLDIGKSMANDDSYRYTGKYAQGAVIGPSFGMAEDLVKTMQKLTDGEVSDNDKKATLRLLPFNNLFYIQSLTNELLDQDK